MIVAETEQVALGLALEKFKYTKAAFWSIREIDPTKEGIYEVVEND